MIYSLSGIIKLSGDGMFVVECGGIGFLCKASQTTLSSLPNVGQQVFVYTMMTYNQENGTDLYGFADKAEQEFFVLLTGVNGIGPKAALSILSEFSPDELALAIASGDSKSLTRAKGIGPKAAQRIILELSEKVTTESAAKGFTGGNAAKVSLRGNAGEAIAALVSLGYTNSEAASAVSGMSADLPVDELIRGALKALASKR